MLSSDDIGVRILYPEPMTQATVNVLDTSFIKCQELDRRPEVDDSGCFNYFYFNGATPNDETGPYAIKMCTSKHWRDVIYERQALAAKHGFAPPVGNKINWIFTKDGSVQYGYETRCADSIVQGESGSYYDQDVCRDLVSIGIAPGDIVGNCGSWQGKNVCIDFGLGTEDYQERAGRDNVYNTFDGKPFDGSNARWRGAERSAD